MSQERLDAGGVLTPSPGVPVPVSTDVKQAGGEGSSPGGVVVDAKEGENSANRRSGALQKGSLERTTSGGRLSFAKIGIGKGGVDDLSSKEASSVIPRAVNSGREALKKVSAVAAFGAGEASRRVPWVKRAVARGSRRPLSRRNLCREGNDPGEMEKEAVGHQEAEEGDESGASVKAPLLSIEIGGVSGFLPDVQWSVQIQQKLIRIEDSGWVK